MNFLKNILLKDHDFSELLSDIRLGHLPLACTGLSAIHKAVILSSVFRETKQKITVITQDEASAAELTSDIKMLGLNAINFPLRDYCLGNLSGYSREYEHKRTDTLSALADGAFDLLVLSVDAAIQYTVPPELLANARFNLKTGDITDISQLTERLLSAGYIRSEICEGEGQFSVRGGIFDIFPISYTQPCRIEFWGDEIDNISYFDTATQRRGDTADSIEIAPACEILYNPAELAERLSYYLSTEKGLSDKQRERLKADIQALENGISIMPDRYIPLIYPGGETVFDYVSDTAFFISESGNISERFKSLQLQQSADI